MRPARPVLLALAFTVSIAASARAEERVVYEDTVVVHASKTGSRLADLATSATVVSPRQLRLGSARTLAGALTPLPGVHVLDLAAGDGGGAVEARGFAAQGTTSPLVVLVDEMPVNDFETGRVEWSQLAQPQVERVEFLRGPASFLYGTAAMAGLVNLVTVPAGAGRSAWAEAGGGDDGRARGAAGGGWSGDRAAGSVSGSWQRASGERDHSEFRSASGYAFARVALSSRWSARARLLGHDGEQQLPGPLPDPAWRDDRLRASTPRDRRDTRRAEGALELQGALAPALSFTLHGSAQRSRTDATETIFPVGALDRASGVAARRAETRLHWTPARPWLGDLLLGGEVRAGQLDSRYTDAGALVGQGVVRRTNGAVFALARVPLHDRLHAVAGGRLDWLRSTLEQPLAGGPRGANEDLRAASPTLGLTASLARGAHAWLSYSGAFKAPELEQLYDQRPYDFGGGPFLISNAAIQPQRGDHWDAGLRTPLGRALALSASVYHARSRNEIGFDLANFRLSNIDRSRHVGVETQLTFDAARGLSGALSHAWTSATFVGGEHDGRQINTVPEQQAFARLTWEHAARGSISAELQYTGRQWLDEDETYPLPEATLLHVSATQRVGAFECFASANNVTDRRQATLGYVTVDEFGGDLPLVFPGAGRSFTAGVRARFAGD